MILAIVYQIVHVTVMMEFGKNQIEESRILLEVQKALLNSAFLKTKLKKCNIEKTVLENIDNYELMNYGTRNITLKLKSNSNTYVIRTSRNSDYNNILQIDFTKEKIINEKARFLGIDNAYIDMDIDSGFKISEYIPESHILNTRNKSELQNSIQVLKNLHNCKWRKNNLEIFKLGEYYDEMNNIIKGTWEIDYPIYKKIFNHSRIILIKLEKEFVYSICHMDCHCGNFLVDTFGRVNLIDYEFSSIFDYRFDIASLVVNSNLNRNDRLVMYYMYYGFLNDSIINFLDNMCILNICYNIQWSLLMKKNSVEVDNYIIQNIKYYMRTLDNMAE